MGDALAFLLMLFPTAGAYSLCVLFALRGEYNTAALFLIAGALFRIGNLLTK